jgi:hypothetical protein
MTKDELLDYYAGKILPVLPLAKKAYGSRETDSPQHDASREYTRLLVEYYTLGGSLLDMAARLDVTYAGIRRRVTTADIPASTKRPRVKFSQEVYDDAVADIVKAKGFSTEHYHKTLKFYYDEGLSMAKLATEMGLSSANPLYYGIYRVRIHEEEDKG